MGVAWNEAIKEFEATHPGVKVKLELKGFEQIQKTAPMIVNSNSAPERLEGNKGGNATAGLLSKQGLLEEITPEVKKRGLGQAAQPERGGRRQKYDDKGIMGGDKWYGVPTYAGE